MENNSCHHKALDAAYRLLAARSHTRAELRRKLSRKKYAAAAIDAAITELAAKGYLDEEAMAERWAQALARDRLWGPLKIGAWLQQKGIGRDTIDRVQRDLWQELDEQDLAARALRKRFGGPTDGSLSAKKAAFLRSRGFSSGVVCKTLKEPSGDEW